MAYDQGVMDKRQSESQPWYTAPWFKWGAIVLFVLWLFYGLSAYYVVQKPLTAAQVTTLVQHKDLWQQLPVSATAVGRSLLEVLVALWLTAVALGIGLWLLTWLRLPSPSALETALYAVGLGFGVMGLLVLWVGLAGWLNTAVLYALTLLLTVVALPPVIPFLRRLRISPLPRTFTIFLAFVMGLALFKALLPPNDWDGLFYHLKGPKLYLETGQIVGGIDIPHLNFPFLFEMLFLLAMGLRSDVAAKLLHFVFIFLLGGLVYTIARDRLQLKQGWTALLFLFSMPMILTLGTQAYNDLALAFYQVAALLALFNWQDKASSSSRSVTEAKEVGPEKQPGHASWLVLSGALCGLAMGLKYTSFVTPLTLAILVGWDFRKAWRAGIRPLLLIATPAAILALPWYLKSLLFTGNPVYPFLFGGQFWDDFRTRAYAGPGTGIGLDPIALLRLPHDLTLGLKDASGDGQTGPFFLIFLPLILVYLITRLGRRAPRPYVALLLFALCQYLFWMVGVIASAGLWQTRLMLPAFVALCPVLAWLLADLARFDHPQFSLRRFVGLVIAFALVLNLMAQVTNWLAAAPHRYVLGPDSREDVLGRLPATSAHIAAMQGINTLLPERAVVVFLYEPRSYYCNRDCRPDSILDTLGHLEYLYGDAAAIAQAWQAGGVTHVLLFDAGYHFLVETKNAAVLPQNAALLETLRQGYLEPVAAWEGTYSLYALKR